MHKGGKSATLILMANNSCLIKLEAQERNHDWNWKQPIPRTSEFMKRIIISALLKQHNFFL